MSSSIVVKVLSLFLLFAVGCVSNNQLDKDKERGADLKHAYEEVIGGGSLYKAVSACELFSRPGPVGVFKIHEITSELRKDDLGVEGPWIEVTTELEEVLFGEVEKDFKFYFKGGYASEDSFLSPTLSARKGERVVMFIRAPKLGIYTELQIFREIEPDRFSNGQLFSEKGISIEELRKLVYQVRSNDSCPFSDDFGFEEEVGFQGEGDIDEGEAIISNDID